MIILRGQPTFYGQRFSRYVFLTNLSPFWPNFGIWTLFCILGHFRLSERYIYLKTPIVNQVLWSIWGINRHYMASGFQDMNFWPIWPHFGPILAFWPIFAFLGHFRLSDSYIYLKTTIVNHSCDHFEGSTDFVRPVLINTWYLVQFWVKLRDFGLKMVAHPGFWRYFEKNVIFVLFRTESNFLGGRPNNPKWWPKKQPL